MDQRQKAMVEFRRLAVWVLVAAVLMSVAAIIYLSVTGDLKLHMVVATILGVFFSVALGGGLMAAIFFSDKSGHDQEMTDATNPRDVDR